MGEYVFTRAGIVAVDRDAIEEHGIPSIVLMEHAAAAAAAAILQRFGGNLGAIHLVCGSGNNGGDGYALARLLADAGHPSIVHAVAPPRIGGDAEANARRAAAAGIVIDDWTPNCLADATLVIDALLGTGLDRPLQTVLVEVVEAMNAVDAPLAALDIPSGLDCDAGTPLPIAVEADLTVTFGGRKIGFDAPGACRYCGEITVGDIGCPESILAKHALACH